MTTHYGDFCVDYPKKYADISPPTIWKHKKLDNVRTIHYWRDLAQKDMDCVTENDLYFDNWPISRRRQGACLPLYYSQGERFIKLEKAGPAGFLCAKMPMNIKEVREVLAREAGKNFQDNSQNSFH